MLAAFEKAVKRAYTERKPVEQLAKEVEKIDPSFGDVVRNIVSNKWAVGLVIILALSRRAT
jgi:hypothetical protein